MLSGLAEAGQDVTGVDLIVGTSAGSTVGAQLGSGLNLEELYLRQVEPELQAAEIMVDTSLESWVQEIGAVMSSASSIREMRRAVGQFALEAATVPESERRAVGASQALVVVPLGIVEPSASEKSLEHAVSACDAAGEALEHRSATSRRRLLVLRYANALAVFRGT